MAFAQGRMTMDEYSNQFTLIAANTNISDKEQVPYYQRGIDPKVMDKIYDKETLPKNTIQDWIKTACEIDGHMRARSAQKAILTNSTSTSLIIFTSNPPLTITPPTPPIE